MKRAHQDAVKKMAAFDSTQKHDSSINRRLNEEFEVKLAERRQK